MSDDQRADRPKEHEDDVEAHTHHRLGANDEAGDEAEENDEVEAHAHHRLGIPKGE